MKPSEVLETARLILEKLKWLGSISYPTLKTEFDLYRVDLEKLEKMKTRVDELSRLAQGLMEAEEDPNLDGELNSAVKEELKTDEDGEDVPF